ncbi:MAG TPA: hypothetical protein ENG35_04265 [Desulfobacteraceae bacterium]|nr:hypothetical protein [Desulfobacteraceae bacterium]
MRLIQTIFAAVKFNLLKLPAELELPEILAKSFQKRYLTSAKPATSKTVKETARILKYRSISI